MREVWLSHTRNGVTTSFLDDDVTRTHVRKAMVAVGVSEEPVAKERTFPWTSKQREAYVKELRRLGFTVHVFDNRRNKEQAANAD